MKYPKLWDGPSAVGEAADRANRQIDTPYLTHSGPGFTARKKGDFSEVTLDPAKPEQPEPDGWYAATNPNYPPIKVVGSSSPRRPFKKRFEVTPDYVGGFGTGGLWPTDGRARMYVESAGPMHPTNVNYRQFSLLRSSYNVRRTTNQFNFYVIQYSTASLAGVFGISSGGLEAFYDGYNSLIYSTVNPIVNSTDSRYLQLLPRFTVFVEIDHVWYSYNIDVPVEAGKIYGLASYVMIDSTSLACIYGAMGELPKMYVTRDMGQTWAVHSLSSLLSNALLISPTNTLGDVATANPAYNQLQVVDSWVSAYPFREMVRITGLPSIGMQLLNKNEILITCNPYVSSLGSSPSYHIAYGVINLNSGSIRNATTSPSSASGYVAAQVIGKDAAIFYIGNSTGDTEFVTVDGLQTTQTITTDPSRGQFTVFKPYDDGKCDLYYTQYEPAGFGTKRHIMRIKDLEPPVECNTPLTIGVSSEDYNALSWVGSKNKPAPIYPPFPWTRDSRVHVPNWW